MNLYVSNLSQQVQAGDLAQLFAGYGQVVYARLSEEQMEKDEKGYALVYVPTAEQAERAVAAVDGTVLKGERLCVRAISERRGVIGQRLAS